MSDGLVTSWYRKRRSGAVLDTTTPLPPFNFGGDGLESVHGDDDSVVVQDTANPPWRPMICLRVYTANELLIGSGILIAPTVILTAAHNVYRLNVHAYAKSIVAHIGLTSQGKAGAEARGVSVECPLAYTKCRDEDDPGRYPHDYAIIKLDSDALAKWAGPAAITNVPAQAPMTDGELMSAALTIAGYPVYQGQPIQLRRCDGKTTGRSLTNFNYSMDTMPGQSGGPVFRINVANKSITFAGVHIANDEKDNRGRLYNESMQKDIKAWTASGAQTGRKTGV